MTQSQSHQIPREYYYQDPVYDMTDANNDGVLDNPGEILYYVPTRTGQKDNHNFNAGFSATLSIPLNKKQQKLCTEAAKTHNEYRAQLLANKRLDFEIARLKNCGELIKAGIMFHPQSPYAVVCSDVVVMGKNAIQPHVHSLTYNDKRITSETFSGQESSDSSHAGPLGAPISIQSPLFSQQDSSTSSSTSSQQVLPPSEVNRQEVLREVPKLLQP